jgi:hypothetical protein
MMCKSSHTRGKEMKEERATGSNKKKLKIGKRE